MNEMMVTLSDLLNMLQSTEELIKKENGSLIVIDKSINSELKPKAKKFEKKNGS